MNKKLFKILTFLLILLIPITLVACKKDKDGNENSQKQITSIEVSATAKNKFFVDDTLDLTNFKIKVYYNDNSSSEVNVTSDMVSGFDSSTTGSKILTITYCGKTCEMEYTVVNSSATKITLITAFETEYFQNDDVNTSGGIIKVEFSKDEPENIPVTPNMISNYDNQTVGTRKLKITYLGAETEVEYTIKQLEVTQITVATSFKTNYFVGDALDLAGGKIKVSYNNKATEILDITLDMISDFSSLESGEFMLTITYLGLSETVEYVIEEPEILEITLKTDFKRLYYVGESKDYTGGEIRVSYSDGTYKDILLTSLKPTAIKGFSTAKAGTDKDLTITYDGYPLTLSYDVYTLSFEIKSSFKTEYSLNEELDITGGILLVTFGDKETPEEIAITAEMISNFDTSTVGTYYLTITYRGSKITTPYTVVESTSI